MRFLCLPGAYGSADKFQVQLAPILKELTNDGTATFYFTHGPCKVEPPEGFEEFFGEPPYYRFIEPDEVAAKIQDNDVLSRIRDFPRGETAEDTMRELMTVGVATSHRSTSRAIKYLSEVIARRGPFDGIIGYSEGATVASTFLLHEQRRAARTGQPSCLKYGIFFAGWPPVDPTTHGLVLSDETEERIDSRTLHIVGSLDPYLDGSMALYNVCDPDTAYLFDHAKGHTLPRDRETIKELADVVREAISEMKEEGLL
ncbi:hypothetical protein GGTG_07239 [Gaeumannomyces tritici R3-111a-1]|uniref:Serine hydrolase domain-containing protein n=1 Tax=Gaeumannomyces tritici (strain R3-111a-1) TaxID=644352 RepID=J3P142_GAET3|nr:hypothetical protein GGTG_07239 [Gaeumannomyces tritici R3-111a-1]EJT77327.1 hypothetical protein GGTG_07239 [Gaeumannomyces tritici R3-111a-1]